MSHSLVFYYNKININFIQIKFLLLTVFFCLFQLTTSAQSTVHLPSNTSTYTTPNSKWKAGPVYTNKKYYMSANIYLSTEIGMSGTITDLDFVFYHVSPSSITTRTYEIYMGHASFSAFSNSDQADADNLTKVFDGSLSVTGSSGAFNTVSIDLDTDFSYNGSDNLIFLWYDKTGSSTGVNSYSAQVSVSGNRSHRHVAGTSSKDPFNPGWTTTYLTHVPRLTLTMVTANTWDGSSSNAWTTAANWSLNSVPGSSDNVIIADVSTQPVISSAVTVANLTVNSGADITISSNSLTVTGAADCNGTMNIDNAIVNLDGSADFTNGTIDFTHASGKMTLSGAVTSLGTLDENMGTIEYDLATQTVFSDTYHNLTISTAGTKNASGEIVVNNDLTTAGTTNCKLDMEANNLTLRGDLNVGAAGGLDLSDASCVFILNGSSAQGVTHAGGGNGGDTEVLFEDFEDALSGWTMNDYITGTTNWTRDEGAYSGALAGSAYAGSKNALFFATSAYNTKMILPVQNLSGYASAELEFYHAQEAWGGDQGTLAIYYKTSSGGTWTQINSYTSSVSSWTKRTMTLPSINSTYYIAFQGYSEYDYGVVVDNIKITGNGESQPHFRNLTVNNSAGFTLSSDLELSGTLTMISGNITTGSNKLTIASTGSVSRSKSGSKACDCVVGNLEKTQSNATATTYEVGDGTRYRPVIITKANSGGDAGVAETYTVKFNNSQHSTITCDDDGPGGALHHIGSSYYDISRTGSINATIALEWFDADEVDDVSSIRLCHFNSGDNRWEALSTTTLGAGGSGSATTTAGRATATATSFSPFGLGSSNSGNALPIDLVSFTFKCQKNEVELEFVVASQINNDYYTIERSVDNKNWSILTEIAGVEGGNTSTEMSYRWTDYSPLRGMSYYRLTQTDFDGRSEIFAPITVSCRDQEIGEYSVYPNPAKEQLMIDLEIDDYQGENLKVRLMDINGRVAMEEPITLERGFNHLEMNINELPDGVYLLQFTGTKSHIKESRVVKK